MCPRDAVVHTKGCNLPICFQEGRLSSRKRYKWLIWLAMQAAPKPLSMFTTATPGAHEFSMPSSAATPPKLAP